MDVVRHQCFPLQTVVTQKQVGRLRLATMQPVPPRLEFQEGVPTGRVVLEKERMARWAYGCAVNL